MSGLGKEVRKRTDALDSLGNTTAATGKGFAIGSAALTGLALLASYVEEIKIGLLRLGETVLTFSDGKAIEVSKASFSDFMIYYDVTLMNPKVLAGMFLGSMMAFMFCGLTMNAVGRAAGHMVEEVRRQFREIPGILTGKSRTRLRPLRGHLDKRGAARDGDPFPVSHHRTDPHRSDIRSNRSGRTADRRPEHRVRTGDLHGQFGRRLGQRQETYRRRETTVARAAKPIRRQS